MSSLYGNFCVHDFKKATLYNFFVINISREFYTKFMQNFAVHFENRG